MTRSSHASASSTRQRSTLLQVVPDDLHARAPAFLGAADEVERLERYHREQQSRSVAVRRT